MSTDPKALTTAAINRLLRPLRTCCNVLAKLPLPTQATGASRPSATYSSTSTNRLGLIQINQKHDPLVILPPPDKLASQLYFSQEYRGSLELARRVYAVRDAFKNIVVKAKNANVSTRVIPLTALCAITIGQNLQEWEEPDDQDDDQQQQDASNDISYADEMYEAVPAAYRAWLLVSHALAIILDTCPHHPTLICILLDVALIHRLQSEASQLLEALLFLALRPKPNGQSLISSPTHSKFIVEYLDKWISAGFTIDAFMAILFSALGLTENAETWSAKALDTLARRLQSIHPPSLVWLAMGLCRYLSASSLEPAYRGQLSTLLSRWTDCVTNNLLSTDGVPPYCDRAFEYLRTAQHGAWNTTRDESTSVLKDSLCCLAIQLIASPGSLSQWQLDNLGKWLSLSTPRALTFSILVKGTLSPKDDTTSIASYMRQGHKKLKIYASHLQKRQLTAHEASLWTCALHFVENLENDPSLRLVEERPDIKAYRERVMELVDKAEENLLHSSSVIGSVQSFDDLLDGNTMTAPTPMRKNATSDFDELNLATPARRNFDDWAWEDEIGCWVRQKTQQSVSYRDSLLKSVQRRRIAIPTPRTRSVIRHSTSRDTKTEVIPFNLFKRQKSQGLGDTDRPARPTRPRPSKPLNDFVSLLANAASHRTVLHGRNVPRGASQSASLSRRNSPSCCSADSDCKGQSRCGNGVPIRKRAALDEIQSSDPHQASDDVLDLFAYP
ncbi:hypothetical protein CC1G_07389 [Coprinopsis cinerea okayama7|uniref:Uncharacterized protein n=1 Tax=Coprinopsis cinerea (strain Okayama-7 / 130 / ATCC MYA-4618 / FGSC 9003) TaxID=240176 RepID=A8N6L8_COPC7|nr:hypothetical protein CC1G_07389 [Coprinopsis cinerea okayama7\|eukprot:XP_001830474.2 hypothetical protein CC1G_07389 [Coprinopsis cinerea okayama7\